MIYLYIIAGWLLFGLIMFHWLSGDFIKEVSKDMNHVVSETAIYGFYLALCLISGPVIFFIALAARVLKQ